MNKDFNYSYWEHKHSLGPYDLIVIGAGIVGLSAAISSVEKHKNLKVLVLERGLLPEGASTKNAGFACFGSAGELLDDLEHQAEEQVWEMVQMRLRGLNRLRKRIGDKAMDYLPCGGYEFFLEQDEAAKVQNRLPELNRKLKSYTGLERVFRPTKNQLRWHRGFCAAILNPYEGQLDPGRMMGMLHRKAVALGITCLYGCRVDAIQEHKQGVELQSQLGGFKARACLVATNGFASELLDIPKVHAARAQVLVSSPVPNLKIKGTFHLDRGYYYWRNVDGRILLGGGRHLDFETEKTAMPGLNPAIQHRLDQLLKTHILPNQNFSIERRWTGIMGLGPEKFPVIEFCGFRTLAAVRMGGMGIAIGSEVGALAAKRLEEIL